MAPMKTQASYRAKDSAISSAMEETQETSGKTRADGKNLFLSR